MLDVGLKTTWKKNLTGSTKKKPQTSSEAFLCGIRQRPTLPGDFFCLNPAQRAAEKILTKYNVAHSLKTTGEMDVTDAQSFFRAFPPTLPGVPPCAGSATGGAHGGT